MNHIERIAHFSKNVTKVIASHGVESGYATYAFYQLQAAKMGMPLEKINAWAEEEMARLKAITLENV